MKIRVIAVTGAILLMGTAAFAQAPQSQTPPARKPGLLSRLFHPHPKTNTATGSGSSASTATAGHHSLFGRRSIAGNTSPISGGIVGNKNTHVYHLPGDGGTLPAPQNRVYFRTEAQARAAGYHASRQKGAAHTHH